MILKYVPVKCSVVDGNNGVTDYKHCMECAHKWEPGTHKRSINCENIWFDD